MALVFSYVLEDPWENIIFKTEVTDEKRRNIFCIYHMYDWQRKATIKKRPINQIYKIVKENHQIFSYEEIEGLPFLLDGFVQVFTFSDGKELHTIRCVNLHYFAAHPETLEQFEHARTVLSVFQQIREILLEHGALEECFELDSRWFPYVDDYYEDDYFKFYPDDFFLKPPFG
ncbi:MAG: hypothetical protein V3G42_08095 [Oscillospiraceae bacterium]